MELQDDAWAAALAEVESDARQPGLWARCFAQAGGDENKAKAAYIAERVGSPAPPAPPAPPPPATGVCPSCGRGLAVEALECLQCGAMFGPTSAWQPRARQLGEALVPDLPQPEPAKPRPVAAVAAKPRANWLLWIIVVPVGLFVAMMIIGSLVPKETSDRWAKEKAIDEACERMIGDSALGYERRMTRQMCDEMRKR